MQRQVSLTKNQLRDLRMSNDSNQAKLIDHGQRQGRLDFGESYYNCSHALHSDQEVVAKLAEVDMIVADLERANSRVVTVERRNVRTSIKCALWSNPGFRKFSGRRSRPCAQGPRILIGNFNSKICIAVSNFYNRVKSLESQVADLEAESERLSRVLEAQKQAASDAELTGQKKMEELSRDIKIKVRTIQEVVSSTYTAL